MTTSHNFTAAWQRFFLIAGNIFFFFAFCVLLATGEQDLRSVSNRTLFAFNLLITLLLFAGYFYFPGQKKSPGSHPLLPLAIGYLLLFLLQCIYIRLTWFYTGWDVGLIRVRLEGILAGQTMQEVGADVGYSIYPNNLLLFYIQYLIVRAGAFFSVKRPYNLCIYSSCLCVTLSCFLGNLTIRKVTQHRFVRFLYTLASTVYILFSPWIMIPYSDTYGILFVSLGLWAMLCVDRPIIKWPVLTFATMIGYHIKPTCIFLLFAAIVLYLPDAFRSFRQKRKELCILLLGCLIFFGIGQGISLWVQHSLDFELDPERKIPPTHYIMMGLNADSRGGFDAGDYAFTTSLATYEEKIRRTLRETKLRWTQMTPAQKRDHYLAKFLYTYNDGTFSWTKEGGFYEVMPGHDNPVNDWYVKIFTPEGKYFAVYCGFAQTIWLQLLLGILFLFLKRKEQTSRKAFLMIVLCGLTAFLMLFETRARYLFLYSPAYLILSLYGYESFFSAIAAKLKIRKGRQTE